MSDLVFEARAFATVNHAGQKRKYDGAPYIEHPARVAETVSSFCKDEAAVAAAWLHDTVEDCGVTLAEIRRRFGDEVHGLVRWLTHVYTSEMFPHLNRATRKRLEADRLSVAPATAQTVKYADVLDNTKDIVSHDAEFATVYVREMRYLLSVCIDGDPALYAHVLCLVVKAEEALVAPDAASG